MNCNNADDLQTSLAIVVIIVKNKNVQCIHSPSTVQRPALCSFTGARALLGIIDPSFYDMALGTVHLYQL